MPSTTLERRSRASTHKGVGLNHWGGVYVVVFLLCLMLCTALSFAKTKVLYTKLLDLTGPNGYYPTALVQGTDGNLYGATYGSIVGPPGHHTSTGGIVYKMTPAGEQTVLYTFCTQPNCPDGDAPNPLLLATNGNFYGTTPYGGAHPVVVENGPPYGGTIFEITPAGELTTLYSFCAQTNCADGSNSYSSLLQGTDGNFYGTTSRGGANGGGTIFRVSPAGKLTTLYSFPSMTVSNLDMALIQGTNGDFYGTTESGGANAKGTIFKITPTGKLTTLYSFCSQANCADGSYPEAGVIQATDGNFYGTTYSGGAGNFGSVFRITTSGTLTTLYSFCTTQGCPDGATPQTSLTQGTDGNFYGTTGGTQFSITTGGTLMTLHQAGGTLPTNALIQATNGAFYSTTYMGGKASLGSAYSLTVGLGPFLETVQPSAKVGKTVTILGQGFTGTTEVSFNAISASYTIISDTYLTATVPAGATTGLITVVTPSGTLTSNKPFVVKP